MNIEKFWAISFGYQGKYEMYRIYASENSAKEARMDISGDNHLEEVYGLRVGDRILVLGKDSDTLYLRA